MNANQPEHLAIIMDGNGRWALDKGRDRIYGHIKGARVAKKIIEYCAKINLKELTLYAFSTENWARPKGEVDFLMRLLLRYIRKEKSRLAKQNVSFNVIGDIKRLPLLVQEELEVAMKETQENKGLRLTFALNYGGRQEIVNICKKAIQELSASGLSVDSLTEEHLQRTFIRHSIKDPDLIIRSSGECRLSNFLLWQSAYSEFYFTKILWPDFTEAHLRDAFSEYAKRVRRFGGIEQNSAPLPFQIEAKSVEVSKSLGALSIL